MNKLLIASLISLSLLAATLNSLSSITYAESNMELTIEESSQRIQGILLSRLTLENKKEISQLKPPSQWLNSYCFKNSVYCAISTKDIKDLDIKNKPDFILLRSKQDSDTTKLIVNYTVDMVFVYKKYATSHYWSKEDSVEYMGNNPSIFLPVDGVFCNRSLDCLDHLPKTLAINFAKDSKDIIWASK